MEITESMTREILKERYHPNDIGIIYNSHSVNGDDLRISFVDRRLRHPSDWAAPTQYIIIYNISKNPIVIEQNRNDKIDILLDKI